MFFLHGTDFKYQRGNEKNSAWTMDWTLHYMQNNEFWKRLVSNFCRYGSYTCKFAILNNLMGKKIMNLMDQNKLQLITIISCDHCMLKFRKFKQEKGAFLEHLYEESEHVP